MGKIEKIWINNGSGEDNIIVVQDNIIYRFRGDEMQCDEIRYELSKDRLDKRLIGLPLVYVKTMEFRESLDYIKFNYNKESVDRFTIKDYNTRKEIFDYVRFIKDGDYTVKRPKFFRRTRSPLIALGVVLIAFFFVYMVIQMKQEGAEVEGAGLFAFIVIFAEFGLAKNVLGFSIVSLFLGFRIWAINRANNEELHTLKYR